MDIETFKVISFFVVVFLLICLTIWYFISVDKQMKLYLKQDTEKFEKFKSQIKPVVLLRIEKEDYTPFDESKYEVIEILEIREGWAKYIIDGNREREYIDQIRTIYEIGYEIYRIYRKEYEIVQPETM